jgi:hypothetical protein
MIFQPLYGEFADESLYVGIMNAFEGDYELVDKYHYINSDYIECVTDTYLKIKDAQNKYPLDMYEIKMGEEIIGYVVICKTYNFLYSFGINVNQRTPKNMEYFFKKIAILFNGGFTCGLWAKNMRAIEYLLKNGMEIYKREDNQVHLIYN